MVHAAACMSVGAFAGAPRMLDTAPQSVVTKASGCAHFLRITSFRM
jgi:hypothetical protein